MCQAQVEELPASWAIRTEGRPEKEAMLAASANNSEAADDEDAVCMVCFDGTPEDNNQILFCDGCNMSVHQGCYGVRDVPEGDFFCQRCHKVAYEMDIVRCALCPLVHGAMKRTTDNRWVHLACAMWAPGAVITNIESMGPVDIS
ncbi:unnamed protein product, partial [Discosporangium mesarthrocarpum]